MLSITSVLTILALVATIKGERLENEQQHIVGGYYARIEDYPAVINLRNGYSWQNCGGTFISRKHVLTAAHCVFYTAWESGPQLYQMKWYNVLSGDTNRVDGKGLKKHNVSRVDIHSSFFEAGNSMTTGDIAILTLEQEIEVGPTRRPAQLPYKDVFPSQRGTVLGWGWDQPENSASIKLLKAATLHILDNNHPQCYGTPYEAICTIAREGTAFCNGDSGGPFFIGNTVVGVVSNSVDCTGNTPGMFTKVYAYRRWIDEVMSGRKSRDSATLPIGH